MLLSNLQRDLITSLKNKEVIKTSIIRLVLSAVNYKKIELQREITDEDIISVVRKLIKQHEESIMMFEKGHRQDLVIKEEEEMLILKNYLPKEVPDDELEKEVRQILGKIKDQLPAGQTGRAIGLVVKELKGKAESSRIAGIVKKVIANS